MFTKINLSTWNRKHTFDVFTNGEGCCFSLTCNIEITAFLAKVKQNKEKFFPKFLFGFCNILNQHEEFRMDRDSEGNIGFYDVIHPCFTVFHEQEEIITLLWTEFSNDHKTFVKNYEQDMELYSKKPFEPKELNIKNFFHISNTPWLAFSSVRLSKKNQYENFIPMFTVGKYFEQNNKILIPIAIHANHAVIDGFHVARLFKEFEAWLAQN